MPDALIAKLRRLGPVSVEEIEALEDAARRVRQLGPREDIVRDGERPSECSLILEGFACRYKLTPNGKRQIMAFQIPGDVVDLHSLLLREMDHAVGTMTPCRVALIPQGALLELMDRHPRLARALWRDTLVDSAIFRAWMIGIGRRSAYQRIAHLLCEVFVRVSAVGLVQDHSFDFPVTQADLGDSLGLSVVHVNRVLQALRGDGLITLKGRTLTIRDWQRLKQAGQFEPSYLHLDGESAQAA
jgi:CRP-like cAMP-binding protein